MSLNDTACRNAKPKDKPYKLADGQSMYLLVKTDGARYWRWDYSFAGRRKTLALGVYPEVSLKEAREALTQRRSLLAKGQDPAQAKRIERITARTAAINTFEAVAREFHTQQAEGWSGSHAEKWLRYLEKDAFPYIGRLTLPQITAPVLLDVLRRMEKRGVVFSARILGQYCGQVFRYGIQTGRCERNPVPDLRGALKPHTVKHMAAVLEPRQAGALLRAFDDYAGQPTTKAALQLSALLFQRPGNIRQMQWVWLDLDAAMLTIPSMEMKRKKMQKLNGRPHLVPLAPQAVEILKDIQPLTGHGHYVFPSIRTGERPMSENTINAALRGLGFDADTMSAHGFRAMARTLMVEQLPDVSADVIEAQLAHGKSGPLGAAYDRAQFMEQRRKLMNTWANYLDKLRKGADVVQLAA